MFSRNPRFLVASYTGETLSFPDPLLRTGKINFPVREYIRPVIPAEARWRKKRYGIEQHTFMGTLWIAAWLFTIGFLHLGFWKGVLAIVLWPYYLGAFVRALAH